MTDPMGFIRTLADRIACARVEREESRRLVLVPTVELAAQVEALTVVLGGGDVVRVQVSPLVPPDQAWVVDVSAMEAAGRQARQWLSGARLFGGAP